MNFLRSWFLPAAALILLQPAEGPFRDLSFDDALSAAKKESKVVMVDFFTTWCGPCKKLDAITWKDAKVQAWLRERTVPLKIDAEKEVDLAKRYRIAGYPTLLFVKPDGAEIGRLLGYQAPDRFLSKASTLAAPSDPVDRAKAALAGREDDPMLRQALGEALAAKGSADDALQEFLWCFDRGVEKDSGYAGARGSSLVRQLGELAKKHPPARGAMLERRDSMATAVLDRKGSPTDPSLVARIDRELGQSERSLELHDELAKRGPTFERSRDAIGAELRDAFIEGRRYEDALRLAGDVPTAIETKAAAAKRARGDDRPGSVEGDGNSKATVRLLDAEVEELARSYFEAYLGAGRAAEADRIAESALGHLPQGALCAALVDGAIHAEAYDAARKLGQTWVERLPESERVAVRDALERIPRKR